MKKIITLLLVALFLAPSFALATSFTTEAIKSGTDLISTLSNKVTLAVNGNALTYAAISGHLNGNKLFGSSSTDTKIYVQASDPVAVADPGASDSSEFTSNWTAL